LIDRDPDSESLDAKAHGRVDMAVNLLKVTASRVIGTG
jgi:hypothetical protein